MTNQLQHVGVMGMHWGHRSGRNGPNGERMTTVRGKVVSKMTLVKGKPVQVYNRDPKIHSLGKEAYSKAHYKFQSDLLKLQKSGKGNDTAAVIKLSAKYDKSLAKIKNKKVSKVPSKSLQIAGDIAGTVLAAGLGVMSFKLLKHALT